ncbi:MAG: hypothetical protein JO356_17430 [Acidobacteria bacterium]|nr:hypothetical protein [Acidobacteriota bacterium]
MHNTKSNCKAVTFTVLVALLMGFGSAAAQTQNPVDAIKDVWNKAKQQQQKRQPAPQPGRNTPNQPTRSAQPGSGPAATLGSSAPPAGTKIEQTVLAPINQGDQFGLSPHGVHAATLSSSGSRKVMIYDGAPGPVFDQPIQQGGGAGQIGVTFSPDGSRYSYCAQVGDHFVVMVDGKEVGQSSHTANGGLNCELFFSPNNKHFYYSSIVNEGDARRGLQYTTFVMDGKTELRLANFDKRNLAFSPDGDHFAMVQPLQPTPQQIANTIDTTRLIVDGTPVPYQGGAPQWSADSKHLYTTVIMRDGSQVLQLDGKPLMHATRIDLTIPPVGDMTVAIVYLRSAGPPPVTESRFLVVGGKKVAASEIKRSAGSSANGSLIEKAYISPDGGHYAAICTSQTGKEYVFVDGKKGLEYSRIDGINGERVMFAADSSKVAYLGFNGSKDFLVIGDQETVGFWGGSAIVIPPVGSHVGTYGGVRNPATLDGKPVDPEGAAQGQVMQLTFSPDGQRYAFVLNTRGQGLVYVDGVRQTEGFLAGRSVLFSPDSKHVAFFCWSSDPAAPNNPGICMDGKYAHLSLQGSQHLTFTPDSNHLLWTTTVSQPGAQQIEVFADGRPVYGPFYSVTQSGAVIPDEGWQMQTDGTLLFLAQIDNAMKRISLTPSPDTSAASLFGGTPGVSASR